jgi:ABC-type protease/lipase transport system fused ATPase/permease subunit
LLGLCSIAALLYFFQGFLDVVRSRILLRVGSALTPRVFDLIARLPLKVRASCDSLQPLRDLDQIGNFMSGIGPAALCDLPWVPIYVVICWAFHPLIGIAALGGSLLLFSLTLWTEVTTRKPAQDTGHAAGKRVLEATRAKSNAEVLLALGMRSRLSERWIVTSAAYRQSRQKTADIAAGIGGCSKIARMALQSGVLALGAWLVIQQQATAGVIIAGSILTSRALAPVEIAIGNWKGFVTMRQSWRRLSGFLKQLPLEQTRLKLPPPAATLVVQGASVAPPGATGSRPRCELFSQSGSRTRNYWTERIWKVFARASSCWCVACCLRQGSSRWRGP